LGWRLALRARRHAGEEIGYRGGALGPEQFADPVEAVDLGAIDVRIQLVGEPPGLSRPRHGLGRVQTPPKSVGDCGKCGDDEQQREEEAHSAPALG